MSLRIKSYAKVNLSLRVLGRRPDGYHELSTVFQTVDLADRIRIEPTRGPMELTVSAGDAPEGEANLAFAAALRFGERWDPGLGVKITLEKSIPTGGGLGGGSSDAATVLMALAEEVQIPRDDPELIALAASLGADVPYFLVGGTALGTGRGDRIAPLPELPEREITLVTPPVSISTAEVFAELAAPPVAGDAGSGRSPLAWAADWSQVGDWENDLEGLVLERYPPVRDVYNALVEAGAAVVRLSGTGATLFALFSDAIATSRLAALLPAGSRIVQTRTLTRSSIERHRFVS